MYLRQVPVNLATMSMISTVSSEAEFLDVIETKSSKFSSLLFKITSTNGFYSVPPLSKSDLKLVCNVNIVYGNLKSENSEDYAQKPQRNCPLMNSASGLFTIHV